MVKYCVVAFLACCLAASGQNTKGTEKGTAAKTVSTAKSSAVDWRKAEEKFCKFIGAPEIIEELDHPKMTPPPGLRGYSFVYKTSGIRIAEIEKACGAPTRVVTDKNTKQKIFFYGRVGYTTKDGKTLDQLTIVLSITGVDEYEK